MIPLRPAMEAPAADSARRLAGALIRRHTRPASAGRYGRLELRHPTSETAPVTVVNDRRSWLTVRVTVPLTVTVVRPAAPAGAVDRRFLTQTFARWWRDGGSATATVLTRSVIARHFARDGTGWRSVQTMVERHLARVAQPLAFPLILHRDAATPAHILPPVAAPAALRQRPAVVIVDLDRWVPAVATAIARLAARLRPRRLHFGPPPRPSPRILVLPRPLLRTPAGRARVDTVPPRIIPILVLRLLTRLERATTPRLPDAEAAMAGVVRLLYSSRSTATRLILRQTAHPASAEDGRRIIREERHSIERVSREPPHVVIERDGGVATGLSPQLLRSLTDHVCRAVERRVDIDRYRRGQ